MTAGSTFPDLNDEQREAMIGTSNLLLTACPGSGKTRSVAARAAWLRGNGKTFALLSHTNVGAKEVAKSVHRDYGFAVTPDSFVGTLHSFLARYVLLPFGHLATGGSVAVRMDEDTVRDSQPAGLNSFHYRFKLDGTVELKPSYKGDRSATTLEKVRKFKVETAAAGFVNYDDGLYWSHRVLATRPDLAVAVVQRFDELLIDEAQDSSAAQLACIQALRNSGLESLVLVGDFDQSIYGFSGAAPELCDRLADTAGLERKRLTKNYRSSQLICDTSARFRADKNPDTAVGEHKDYPLPPQLIRYNPSDPRLLREKFERLVDQAPGDFDSRVVVTRSNALANVIRGRRTGSVPALLSLLARCKFNEGAPVLDDVLDLQRAVIRRAFGPSAGDLPLDQSSLRSSMMSMIDDLPEPSGDLAEWAELSFTLFDRVVAQLFPLSRPHPPMAVPTELRGENVGDLTPVPSVGLRIESVHGVKGESVDALMLVAEATAQTWHTPQADVWASALSGTGMSTEEHRIFYVAATRARKLLVLAVPDETSNSTVRGFQSAGFEVTG